MSKPDVTAALSIRRREVPDALYAAFPAALDPVLRRVYAARRAQPAEIDAALRALLPVSSLGGVQAAASALADLHRGDAGIVVVGDFDADGATATALMVSALRAMGYRRVSYLVPDRFALGYGLSPAVVDLAAALKPHTLITVDNGISSVDGVERARSLGIEVIVTDHHLPGAVLPRARAIVNPNSPDETFASKALCGVGVAFYVMAALARELRGRGSIDEETARRAVAETLDLVALGTVADLVALDANNRILVSEGLRRIRAGRARPGLRALFAVAGRDPATARSVDLGFGIAPRLNAAGRLTDMSLGIDCLLAADEAPARSLAARLDSLNTERQALQARMQQEAEGHLQGLSELGLCDTASGTPAGLCLFDPGWHEGVVGLVASRMRERSGCPVVAFAPAAEPGYLKGSARSVDGVHIRDVFANVAARGEIQGMSFGGHAMAAGMRLPLIELERFRAAFTAEVSRVRPDDAGRVLWTDGPLEATQLQLSLAEALRAGGPWGQGFPEPLFDNEFEVLDQQVLREAHLRLKLRPVEGGAPAGESVEAIAFRETRLLPGRVRLIYRLDVNDYGGRRRGQLVVEHIHFP